MPCGTSYSYDYCIQNFIITSIIIGYGPTSSDVSPKVPNGRRRIGRDLVDQPWIETTFWQHCILLFDLRASVAAKQQAVSQSSLEVQTNRFSSKAAASFT